MTWAPAATYVLEAIQEIADRLRQHASDLEHDHPDSPSMRDKAEAFLDAADMVEAIGKERA